MDAARGLFLDAQHPVAGAYTHVGYPARIDGHDCRVQRPAPDLGQHTDEILAEAGLDREEIAALRADGVL